RMAGQLARLAAAAVADPSLPLSALPMLAPSQLHQVRHEWNDTTSTSAAAPATLHALIDECAMATPDAIAIVEDADADTSRTATYGDLLVRSGRLAARLRGCGVGAESRVGVLVERSLELPIALLAVLRAGGAYVPLDPSYPAERLAFVLADAAVDALIVDPGSIETLGSVDATVEVPLIDLSPDAFADDRDRGAEPAAFLDPDVEPPVDPDQLAYVIYTSGSTGRPKGVGISHRAIVNRLRWMQGAYRLGADDAVLQKTPYSFDVSVWEFFWPLLVGARLVMARPGGHQDSAYLAATIERHAVTTIHFVPSMLQVFAAEPAAERCRSLRRLVASGEALPLDLVRRVRERLPTVEIHNLYGPTEAAVDVTAWPCRADEASVPIGRPVANTTVRVLDASGRLAAPGVAGEALLGGVQLARGYLGRPSLTAERVVPVPFADPPGGRGYRTGDLVRARVDGAIEYLGRLDHQVKLRGFRIELGEIESALDRHETVREAAVVVHEDRLVAHVVPVDDAGIGTDDTLDATWRAALRDALPEYMVPTAFVEHAALPLHTNGKVDRRALLDHSSGTARATAEHVAPRSALEVRLAELWCELLEVDTVGIDDDFFALGGDSIRGALFVNRLQRELDAGIYVMSRFDAPTVRGF
ncbi:MAG: amino acid adenylation domain-containing protein, partial [Acidobacteriota bacterium]